MKKLNFHYHFQTEFKEPVNHHYFTLKCLPKNEARQTIQNLRVYINSDYNSISQDSFHNKFIYGYKDKSHQLLEMSVSGTAIVDWQQYESDNQLLTVYKLYSAYTQYDNSMENLIKTLNELFDEKDTDYQKALKVMDVVYETMTYEKGITHVHTTAKEAYALKKGVCQDYSHIMLAILRYYKIPCRYVSGLLEDEEFTHAWVEVYCLGRWYGLDPTNHLLVDDRYIVFARGRDAKDTLVNKGVFYGISKEQKQDIQIVVEE